jgi:AraC family transcriptional regulator of adaptative response/methylated-DNA-[protein]-cysteine methyltransferase
MNTQIQFGFGNTSLGLALLAIGDKGVASILLGESRTALGADLQRRFPDARLLRNDERVADTLEKIRAFIATPSAGLELPLDLTGTRFQKRVWRALEKIPAGATASYAEIARGIGAPGSSRAVAQACGANPVALAIPCHRVVRQDGELSGYRWGVERKRQLLELEARA